MAPPLFVRALLFEGTFARAFLTIAFGLCALSISKFQLAATQQHKMPTMSAVPSAALVVLMLHALMLYALPGAQADFDLSTKPGSKVCVGKICDDSSAFHYYECCGQLFNDCCLKLQTWVIVVLAVIGCCVIASFLFGLIKCICCCGER